MGNIGKQGKEVCRHLKEIRRGIAKENDIDLEIPECTFKGECRGTCPRCEAEVEYLEREIARRLSAGKAATVAGIAVTLAAMTGCGDGVSPRTIGAEADEVSPQIDGAGCRAACRQDVPDTTEPLDAGNTTLHHATPKGDIVPPPPKKALKRSSAKAASASDEDTLFDTIRMAGIIDNRTQTPQYSLGEQELFEEIRTLLHVPQVAKENNITGIVQVSITVEADDSVSNIHVVKDIGAGCGEEARRVVKSLSGGWKAARPEGEPVSATRIIDIEFPQDSVVHIYEGGAEFVTGAIGRISPRKPPFFKRLFKIRKK